MKTLKYSLATLVLACALSLTSLAGDMHIGGNEPPPPPPCAATNTCPEEGGMTSSADDTTEPVGTATPGDSSLFTDILVGLLQLL